MIRISSTFSSKPILATYLTLVISIPATLVMRLVDFPNPWMLFGTKELYDEPEFGEYLNASMNVYATFVVQYIINLFAIWPFALLYSFWSIPSRLIVNEEGLRVKNFRSEIRYGFEQVKGLKFKQGESGESFLKLKLHRQWFTFEVDYGQMRTLNKYIPTYLMEDEQKQN